MKVSGPAHRSLADAYPGKRSQTTSLLNDQSGLRSNQYAAPNCLAKIKTPCYHFSYHIQGNGFIHFFLGPCDWLRIPRLTNLCPA